MKTILFWGSKEYPIGYKYSDNLAGGIETSFQRIINGLKNDLKIKIITRRFKHQTKKDYLKKIEIIRIKTPPFGKGLFYNFNSFLYLLFHKKDYDTILCSGVMATFFAGILNIFKLNKFELYCRWDTPAYISKTKFLYPIEKLTYLYFVDKFLLKTEFEVNRIKNLYSIKKINYTIVGFGIDYKLNSKIQLTPNIKKIAYIGRLDKIKNIFLMIDIFSKLNSKLELNIYGDGPLKKKMETYIKLKKLKNIKHHGFVTNIKEALQKNDCLLLLSKTEGLPNVILEAMILKKPVIMSDIGLFNKNIIYPIKLTNSTLMANKIQLYINNKQLQKKQIKEAYNYLITNFNYNNMITNYKTALK